MNESIFLKINSWAGQNIWLDRFMIFSADWLGYFFIGILILYLIHDRVTDTVLEKRNKNTEMFFISLAAAVIARFIFVELIRFFYYNPRPFLVLQNVYQLLDYEAKSSFPSGHAAFYFALAAGVYLYNRKLGWIYFFGAVLMGFARVFSGIHWPVDIIAGAILGIITTKLLSNYLYRIYESFFF